MYLCLMPYVGLDGWEDEVLWELLYIARLGKVGR